MADILYEELVGLNYNPTNDIDDELPPEYVVLYLKNKSTIDKKIIVEPIPLQQILLSNQNPSLRLIDSKAVFCLTPPPSSISCEGAIYSITLESLYPIVFDTENTVIVTVKKGSEIRNHEFQYVDGGSVFGDFWNSYFNDWVELITSDYVTFSNKVAEHVEISIQSARLLNPPYPSQLESAEVNPTSKIIDGVMSFCLAPPNTDICISSPPYIFNTENTIVKVPSGASPVLYVLDKEYGYVDTIHSYAGVKLANEERAFHVSDLSVPNSLLVEVDTPDSMDYDSCSSYSIEGLFYVDQLVQTWTDGLYVGPFYVEINGEKTYLESSSRSFEHGGSYDNLRTLLAPYYLSIETFLKTHGIDAKYDPDSGGSYNTGAILVKLTQEQGTHINIGTDSSNAYQLRLDGYFQNVCQQYKTFEELENSPATITLKPINFGNESRSSFTLLANHVSDNPDEINILTLLGVTEDIDMQTCFRSGGGE